MEFQTFIFEENRKKIIEGRFQTLLIAFVIVTILLPFFLGLPELGLISTFGTIIGLIRMNILNKEKIKTWKDKAALTITEDYFVIRDTKINYSEVSDLVIYVDEYRGMTKDFFWKYHGGNNEIRFSHKNKEVSFNYFIGNKDAFRKVEQIVSKIEKRYPPTT